MVLDKIKCQMLCKESVREDQSIFAHGLNNLGLAQDFTSSQAAKREPFIKEY